MFRMRLWVLGACLACLWAQSAAVVLAQGLLIQITDDQAHRLPRPIIIVPPSPPPVPPAPVTTYQIKELAVQARLIENVARVQVSQTIVNTGSTQIEVSFLFPLPYDSAIDQLTLLVDGQELAGRIMGKDEARQIYEEIVRRSRDPALLEWAGWGVFRTSVFPIPPGGSREVTLSYTQVCQQDHGLTDFLFPLSTAKYTTQPLEKLSVRVSIESQSPIKNIYSPTHAVSVQRQTNSAVVEFQATNIVPTSDFRLFCDHERGPLAARVLSYRPQASDEGYFLLLASPEIQSGEMARLSKTVVFVVDRSGSMSGQKFEQARAALKFVLNNLQPGDLFNIVAYDNSVESFRPELQRFDEETRQAALGFVEGLYAGGSTNIDGALKTALTQLADSSRPNYVLFLTDGLPTVGEMNEMQIVSNAQEANKVRARVLAFGVGYDLNSRLLDRLVRNNFGQSEYVRPDENIETHVARIYQRIESPVLTDVTIRLEGDAQPVENGPPFSRVYPKEVVDLFAGEQLVLVGRYRATGAAKVTIAGSVGGQQQTFSFPAELVSQSNDDSYAFVARLWAMRRIGEIIDQIDLQGQNQELVTELVQLSLQYGILTPYTSFLADETGRGDLAASGERARRELDALSSEVEGRSGVAQRDFKLELQEAAQAPAGAAYGNADSSGGLGRGGTGGQGFGGGGFGAGSYRDAETDEYVAVETVRQVGVKSFYRQGTQWVDSLVPAERAEQAQRVVQFSDDYFALAAKFGQRIAPYLAFEEPVLFEIDDEVYLIEPAMN